MVNEELQHLFEKRWQIYSMVSNYTDSFESMLDFIHLRVLNKLGSSLVHLGLTNQEGGIKEGQMAPSEKENNVETRPSIREITNAKKKKKKLPQLLADFAIP